jgi:hypothetical protein
MLQKLILKHINLLVRVLTAGLRQKKLQASAFAMKIKSHICPYLQNLTLINQTQGCRDFHKEDITQYDKNTGNPCTLIFTVKKE